MDWNIFLGNRERGNEMDGEIFLGNEETRKREEWGEIARKWGKEETRWMGRKS